MANDITNILRIEAPDELRVKILSLLSSGEDDIISLLTFASEPDSPEPEVEPLFPSMPAWYNWRCRNWGTEKGCYDTAVLRPWAMVFRSAWSTPSAALRTLSERFSEAVFSVEFADEEPACYCGRYTCRAGEFTAVFRPDDGSEEAWEIYRALQ